jgi:cytoskeletal protein CcmA (bactofilin family)
MGATYTRQSSYTDGDVITAAHTNDEFDQLLAVFQASSGHTHDGTANEGGPISKLLDNTLTFGAGTAGTDITITFDGETSDGVLKWMEDEDYFEFSDDILVASNEKLQFRDTAIYINSSTDGQLDIIADGAVSIDAGTDIILDADGADVILKDGGTTYGSLTNSSGELVIKSGSTPTTAMTFSGANVTFSGTVTIGSAGISEAELEILDGATVTTTELNIMDGDTTASSTTVVDADRVVFNDAGTMKQVAVTDLAAYFDDEITAMPNLVTTAATTVGALNSGSITSGFGTIDTGSSTITTTGLITGGSLDIDDVVINGTTIGHTDDTDLLTVASGLLTVAGEVSVTTLDIGGTNVTSTAAELNIVDGGTSATSTTLADADRVVVNDNGTMVQVALTDFETYFESALDTLSNVTTVGTLDSGAISSGFGNIDIGSSTANFGATTVDSLSASDGNITNVGDIALDSISADGTDINVAVSDNSGTAFTIKQGSDAYFIVDTGNSSESISIGTGISGTAITLGHSTSEVTVADNLTVTGDLTVSGTTTTVNSTTVNLNDHNIVLDSGNSTSAVINGAGITIEGGSGDDATFTYNTTGPQFELKLGSSFEDLQTAKLTATELDISGDADIDGTLEADAITVNGTALNTVIAGVTVTDATNSAHVLVTDNESTDEDNLITFVENGTSSTGNVGLEMDGDLTYNPSTGRLTATQLAGTLQTAAQANVTSLGTLTTLTVDNVIINGSTIGHTSDTDLMTVASGVLTVAGEVDATSLDISGDADIDGTLEADAITVNGTALNTVIADEATALAIALG